jgi:hypothetical protein
MPFNIAIRDNGKPLWTTIENADIAVMYIRLPSNTDLQLASTDLLATEQDMRDYELRPGDRLFCLGYPLNLEANEAGFPILRSGFIASYPLLPADTVRSFLFDFNIFEGNSGGPVYFFDSNRMINGNTNLGTTYRMVVGLVSQQQYITQRIESLREIREERYQLGLGVVVEAPLIRHAIEKLGPPPPEK